MVAIGLSLTVSGLAGAGLEADAVGPPIVIVSPAIASDVPSDGASGWYTGNVTFGWSIIDLSGLGYTTVGCDDVHVIDTDTAGYTRTCTVTSAGVTTVYTATVQRDGTGPVMTMAADRSANANGWYRETVTFTPSGEDALSGLDVSGGGNGCSAPVTHGDLDGNGAFTATGDCFDIAGNITHQSVAYRYDAMPPTITASPIGTLVGGIYTSAVTVTYSCGDETSGIDTCPEARVFSGDGEHTDTGTAVDRAGNTSTTSTTFTIQADDDPPTITATFDRAAAPTAWWNLATGAPTVTFSCSDGTGSGIASCSGPYTFGEGAGQSTTGTAVDVAGNVATNEVVGVDVDLTAPTPAWNAGPADGGSYVFGTVPAAPSCSSADTLSGPGACTVSGYSTAVGSHTMTATASDFAGNTASESLSYVVTPWTLPGFAKPVDMSGASAVFNSVKKGASATLKFEIFAGADELTDIAAVTALSTTEVTCTASPTDIGTTAASPASAIRKGGVFQVSWNAPNVSARCYRLTVTAADGSDLSAYFRTK